MHSLTTTRRIMSDLTDLILNSFKWPCALVTLLFFPSSVSVCLPYIQHFISSPSFVPFLFGAVAFSVSNRLVRNTAFWQWMLVLEHETVHLIAGIACFKIPKQWRVTSQGGHVGFDRGCNWVITLAPYFLPLMPLLAYATVRSLEFFVQFSPWILPFNMGFFTSVHVAFTCMESDYRQPDIQRVGKLFTLFIAPTLHLLFLTILLIMSSADAESVVGLISELLQDVGDNSIDAWEHLATKGFQILFQITEG